MSTTGSTPTRHPDDARAALVDALTDLLTVHGGKLGSVRALIEPAIATAGRHYETEQGGTVSEDRGPEPPAYVVHEPTGAAYWLEGDAFMVCPVLTSGQPEWGSGSLVEWTEPEHRAATETIRRTLAELSRGPAEGFTLSIELGNAAMLTAEDVGDAVLRSAEPISAGDPDGRIFDANGNTVGRWTLALPAALEPLDSDDREQLQSIADGDHDLIHESDVVRLVPSANYDDHELQNVSAVMAAAQDRLDNDPGQD